MKNFIDINCPLCKIDETTELFVKKDEHFVQCKQCGLVYISPQPSLEALQDTYNDNYADLYVKKRKSKYTRSKRRVKKLLRRKKNAKTFLDIGCSAGFVVEAARDLGLDAYGVEIEKTGPLYAKNVLGLKNIYNCFLEDAQFENQKFDIITFYEVLEHIPNLNNFLQEVKRILSKDGIISVSVPDAGHWLIKNKLETWDAILPSEHLWYFNKNTLQTIMKQNGFKMISISSRPLKANLRAIFQKDN